MEIWLDSTHVRSIQNAIKFGLLAGVTTNPTLLAESNRDFEEVLEDLLHYQEGPVAVQVLSEETDEMVQEGQNFYSMSNRFIIKVPATQNGLEAVHLLSRQGIPTMATAIFHSRQALMASLAGALYVAPYLSHIEKGGENPWTMLKEVLLIFKNYQLKTKILGASLNSIDAVMQCASIGIYGVTLKEPIFESLIGTHPMTFEKVKQFAKDSERTKIARLSRS